MKKTLYYVVVFISINFLTSQELFLQGEDTYKGSIKVDGQEYVTVYDNDSHIYRYFDQLGNEIFLIKSYNEKSEQIALSIEKNAESDLLIACASFLRWPSAPLFDSRSDPARSMRCIFPLVVRLSIILRAVTYTERAQCDRDECSFISVPATARLVYP